MSEAIAEPATSRKPAYGSAEAGRLGGFARAKQRLEQARIAAENATPHEKRRLLRVREQLDRLDQMMMTENDPQRLDRIASAQSKLAEQERILDGRPLPGSRRPRETKPVRVPLPDPE